MFEPKFPQLPFLTREMLTFGRDAKLEIEVVSYANDSGDVLLVGVTRDGIIKFNINHTGDGSEDTQAFSIPDIPISLTLFTDDLSIERGDFYASVYLRINGERVYKLCSGYVSKQSGINFPSTHDESELAGGGKIKVVAGANPAAGAVAYDFIPANEQWKFRGVKVTLVTDANVADRRVRLELPFGGSDSQVMCFSGQDQAASLTRNYFFAPYGMIPDEIDGSDILVAMPPDITADGGAGITFSITNGQATDDFAAAGYFVEQYFQD